jgi:putative pyruvate formate lyase activating enzyme
LWLGVGPDTSVDLMAQYYPAGLVGRSGRDGYGEIDRHRYREEYLQAVDLGHGLGLRRTSAAWPARHGWTPPTP